MRCILHGQSGAIDIFKLFANQILSTTAQGSIRPNYQNPRNFQPQADRDYLIIAGLNNTWYIAQTHGANVVSQVDMYYNMGAGQWVSESNPPYPRIDSYNTNYVGYCVSAGTPAQTYGSFIAFEI